MKPIALLLMMMLFSGAASADRTNPFDPQYSPRDASPMAVERDTADWKEDALKLPPFPKPEDLQEFEVRGLGRFRFFVDLRSISVGADKVVRYTLVAQSASGTQNVSYDGLRCPTVEHRVYATGRVADKSWLRAADSPWTELALGAPGRQHLVLMRDFFCPAGIAIATAQEGIKAMRSGGNPDSPGNLQQFGTR